MLNEPESASAEYIGIYPWLCTLPIYEESEYNKDIARKKSDWEEPYPGFNKKIEEEMKEASLKWRTK